MLSRLDKNEREIERIGAAHDERLDGLERDMKAVATKGDMADIKADLGACLIGHSEGTAPRPYLNTDVFQAIDFAGNSAKFGNTWHHASEDRILAVYIGFCAT